MHQKIDISTSTLVRFLLLLAVIWFAYLVRDVLILLFFVLIIVAGLSPTVDRWAKTITRPGAVVSVFLLLFLAIAGLFYLVIPPFVGQLTTFAGNLPDYISSLANTAHESSGFAQSLADVVSKNLDSISNQLSNVGGAILTQTVGVISGLVAFVTVLVLSFYLLLEEQGFKKMYMGVMPEEWHEPFSEITRKIMVKLGAWIRGQLILMFAVGLATTIGMLLIGSPYALTLGVWSGLTEVIPVVGPIVGAVPGVATSLAQSPLHGLLALMVYAIVQQLENNILVPRIMARAVGLNPVLVILAIIIGGKLYGLTGVFIAVPLTAVLSVVVGDWRLIQTTLRKSS
jgi:predicted PurR-regulated permease PerM